MPNACDSCSPRIPKTTVARHLTILVLGKKHEHLLKFVFCRKTNKQVKLIIAEEHATYDFKLNF